MNYVKIFAPLPNDIKLHLIVAYESICSSFDSLILISTAIFVFENAMTNYHHLRMQILEYAEQF